jgi:hypothetical protein
VCRRLTGNRVTIRHPSLTAQTTALTADDLTTARPLLGTPVLDVLRGANQHSPIGETSQAKASSKWAAYKREERRRDRLGLIKLTAEVSHADWCAAVRNLAAAAERNGNRKLNDALQAIRDDVAGWHDDEAARNAVATSIVVEWVKRWR